MPAASKPDPRDKLIELQAEIISDQRVQIMDLLDRCQEMIGHIHQHQQETAVRALPKFMSEEEQDTQFQLANAGFTREELEQALQELDFANTEITGTF